MCKCRETLNDKTMMVVVCYIASGAGLTEFEAV